MLRRKNMFFLNFIYKYFLNFAKHLFIIFYVAQIFTFHSVKTIITHFNFIKIFIAQNFKCITPCLKIGVEPVEISTENMFKKELFN